MKAIKFFAVIVVTALMSANSYGQTVDEIVDKHVAALGGLDKINAVNTIVTERSMAVGGMEIPNKSMVVVGKALRNESTVMGNKMVEVVEGTSGWMIRPTMMGGTGEPETMPADQIKQRISQLDPFGALVNYKAKGAKIELVGKEKLDKKDVYHLKVTNKEGIVIQEYLDANTYLVSKVKFDINGQEGEIGLYDYKDVDGIKFANTMDISNDQMGVMSFITSKITLNSKLDDSVFKKPVK